MESVTQGLMAGVILVAVSMDSTALTANKVRELPNLFDIIPNELLKESFRKHLFCLTTFVLVLSSFSVFHPYGYYFESSRETSL